MHGQDIKNHFTFGRFRSYSVQSFYFIAHPNESLVFAMNCLDLNSFVSHAHITGGKGKRLPFTLKILLSSTFCTVMANFGQPLIAGFENQTLAKGN